ncbi:hypothetical protein B566_EDAN004673 [Ephemera danica]|nr:hypothetical protein B566_EDAN004673 [Ephemera danica]
MQPSQVNESNLCRVWTNLYGDKKFTSSSKPAFSPGDHVLVANEKSTFAKGYQSGWRDEIFQINRVQLAYPITYTIQDLMGEVITGSFYKQELQKVAHQPNRDWEVGVVEVMHPNTNNMVGDTSVQLLRTLPMKLNKNPFGSNESAIFDTPHYLPVMRRSFDNIQIHLSEETGTPMPFLYGTSCIKLHFRRAPREN